MRALLLLLLLALASTGSTDDPNGQIFSTLQVPPVPAPEKGSTYQHPTEPKYNYAEVIHKSFLFYHSQISGKLPYQRLAWRSDSCHVCSGDFGEDLSGGWYEAANTMKWGLPFGFTVTQLAFNLVMFPEGFKEVDEMAEAIEWVKRGADYIIKSHHNDTHIVGQLGVSAIGPISKTKETSVDFDYWGPAEEYEKWVHGGIMHKAYYITPEDPASEIVAQYGAAAAAASMVLRPHDPALADDLLDRSKRLFKFATTYQGSYVNSKQEGFKWATFWYKSSGYIDEIAWNAAWLYAATNEEEWREEALSWYQKAQDSWYEYSWDDVGAGLHVLLYHLTKDPAIHQNAMSYFNQYLPTSPSRTVQQTPRGLIYFEHWGSLRYAANIAFLMLAHTKDLGWEIEEMQPAITLAIQQVNYILGDYGYSWIVGFGEKHPQHPYHKSSYNSYIDYPMRGQDQGDVFEDFAASKTKQRFILYGAVTGGPKNDDTFYDDRGNYEFSEVTQDYNAAWTGANAGLIEYYGSKKFEPFSDCELDLGWDHHNATKSNRPNYPEDDCYHTCNKNCPRGQLVSSSTFPYRQDAIGETKKAIGEKESSTKSGSHILRPTSVLGLASLLATIGLMMRQ